MRINNFKKHRHKMLGFTLLELMIAIVILGIILTIAIPSFRELTARMRVDSLMTELNKAFQMSRSEAVARSTSVSVCTKNGSACGGSGWNQGFIAFVDINGNGSINNDDEVLLDSALSLDGLTLTATNYGSSITYQADGSVLLNGVISACNEFGYGLTMQVNAVGRPRIGDASSSC